MAGIFGLLLSGAVRVVDQFYEYVTLLLPGNGTNGAQNNTFLDGSTNNFTITRNGNTTQGTFSPFSQTGWGNYFNGSSYLSVASNAAFGISSAWSLECMIYITAKPSTNYPTGDYSDYVVDLRSGDTTNSYLGIGNNSSGNLVLWGGWNGSDNFGSTTISLNTWNYVAYVYDGTTLKGYLNGAQEFSQTITRSLGTNSPTIGSRYSKDAGYLTGYLSNFRLVTAAVTPITPTQPFIQTVNTVLLTCQSNRFVDNSASPKTITLGGSPSVQAFSPFNPTASWSAATNGGSGYFDGSGDYLDNRTVTNQFDVGSAFTFEIWGYVTSYPTDSGWFSVSGSTANWNATTGFYISLYYFSNVLYWQTGSGSGGAVTLTSGTAPPLNSWCHVAVGYNGTTTRMWINGSSVGTSTASYNKPSGTDRFQIGAFTGASTPFFGYLSNVRFVKGTDIYGVSNTSITVPTAPPTAITNTSLLLNFTNAGIHDATSKNDLETVGNAQISTTQSKWGGSSMAFDGTGDYLVGPANNFYNFGTGDFTIECWLRLNATSSAMMIASTNYNSGTGGGGWAFIYRGDISSLSLSVNSNVTYTKSWSPSTSNWYHVAASRSGSSLRLFVDGTQIGTTSTSTDNVSGSSTIVVAGNLGGGTNLVLNGYLQDLRITNYARYTANFTPPTAAFPTL